MNKMLSTTKDYLSQKSNFISWLFLVLAIDYLFLFSLETVLPGFVTAVFNLNFLLLITLIVWFVLTLIVKKENQSFNVNAWFFGIVLIVLLISLIISLIFVLYKASYWESFVYLVLVFVSGKVFYDYVK